MASNFLSSKTHLRFQPASSSQGPGPATLPAADGAGSLFGSTAQPAGGLVVDPASAASNGLLAQSQFQPDNAHSLLQTSLGLSRQAPTSKTKNSRHSNRMNAEKTMSLGARERVRTAGQNGGMANDGNNGFKTYVAALQNNPN